MCKKNSQAYTHNVYHLSAYQQFIFSNYDGKHKFSKIRSDQMTNNVPCVFSNFLCEIALHYRRSKVVLESRWHKTENPNPLMIRLLLSPLMALFTPVSQSCVPGRCQTQTSDISKHSLIAINVNSKIVQWFALEGTLNIIYFHLFHCCGQGTFTRAGSSNPTCPWALPGMGHPQHL